MYEYAFKAPERKAEKVILSIWSESWQSLMPVTVICYEDGKFDLHCQTGDHHESAIEIAMTLLKNQFVMDESKISIMPSGIYYRLNEV